MQVFSSDVYFTVGTNALLASQKEYYSDLVALVDLGHSFVVIDEHHPAVMCFLLVKTSSHY